MAEQIRYIPSNDGQAPKPPAPQGCPGCLFNCYIQEETLGVVGDTLGAKMKGLLFWLLEIPTMIQMARVLANRKKD